MGELCRKPVRAGRKWLARCSSLVILLTVLGPFQDLALAAAADRSAALEADLSDDADDSAAVAAVPDAVIFDLFMISLVKQTTAGRRAFLRQAGITEAELDVGVAFVDQYANGRSAATRRAPEAEGRARFVAQSFSGLEASVCGGVAATLRAYAHGSARQTVHVVSAKDPVQDATSTPSEPGATCEDMGAGWYYADQALDCNANCNEACVKRQVCNGGSCQPWPNYCWQCVGGGPPVGKTCSEMNWYPAEQRDECNADCNGTCVKKQWCDTGYCQPWPNYCWKCNEEGGGDPSVATMQNVTYDDHGVYFASAVTATDPELEVRAEIQVYNEETDQLVTSDEAEGVGDASAAADVPNGGGGDGATTQFWNPFKAFKAVFKFLKKVVNTAWKIAKTIVAIYHESKNVVTCFGNPVASVDKCTYTATCTGEANCHGNTYSMPLPAGGACPPVVKKTYDWHGLKIGEWDGLVTCKNERFESQATPACACASTTSASPLLRSDFNGDYNNDIVWRHGPSGELRLWHMAGVDRYAQKTPVPAAPEDSNWHLTGVADFNGDRQPDLLWQNATSGRLSAWLMQGEERTSGELLASLHDSSWKVVGVGQFNADASPDLLWQSPTGDLYVTLLNGLSVVGENILTPARPVDSNWRVQGVGDFDRDGRADLLLRNSTSGALVVWFMNGLVRRSGAIVTASGVPDASWQVVALVDVNDDGFSDIVWENQVSGEVVAWTMNNAMRTSVRPLNPATFGEADWTIAGPR